VISVTISLNPLLHTQGRDKSFCLFVCFFGGCVSEYLPLGDQKNPVQLIQRIFVNFFHQRLPREKKC
jgi:hypothetical protein